MFLTILLWNIKFYLKINNITNVKSCTNNLPIFNLLTEVNLNHKYCASTRKYSVGKQKKKTHAHIHHWKINKILPELKI